MNHSTIASVSLALLLAAGCSPAFDPASRVEGLRVLAIRAEPPEIAPATDGSAPARAGLASLVVHPDFASDPGRPHAVVLHLACTPAPGDVKATFCTTLSELSDPTVLLADVDLPAACAAPGVGMAGAITMAGFEACGLSGCGQISVLRDPADPASLVALPSAGYELPATYTLANLAAGDARRVLGLEVVDLALTIVASPEELAPTTPAADACAALAAVVKRVGEEWPARAHVASLKRIQVRGPEARSAPNQNPPVSGLTLGGTALPAPGGAPPVIVKPAAKAALLPTLPSAFDTLREEYVRCDSTGSAIETKKEDWTFSWFSTAGDLEQIRTETPSEPEVFTAPRSGTALIWMVVRDGRGGAGWQAGEVVVGP